MCIKIKLTTQQTVLLMAVISPFSCKSVILTYCFEKIAKPLLKPLTHPSQTPQKDLTNPSQTPHKPLTKTSHKLHKAIDQIIVEVSKLPFFKYGRPPLPAHGNTAAQSQIRFLQVIYHSFITNRLFFQYRRLCATPESGVIGGLTILFLLVSLNTEVSKSLALS